MIICWELLPSVGNTAAIDVAPLGRDAAIGIFLNEIAIATIIDIRAFKARAVLVFLDSFAVALSVPIDTAEAIAIGKANIITIKIFFII